ncbi:MAG TPA: maleylpyruvate isomerase N-terminal domain-containing protein [Acidimicrobiia bacterium]
MTRPDGDIDGLRTSHRRLERSIASLTDAQAAAPSRLPDWTVGHVLTHIARNADSVVRRLEGAARGEVVDQYPGGREGRVAEIDAGARRGAAELLADVVHTNRAIDAAIDAMPPAAWTNLARDVRGTEETASAVVFGRWREVEAHHVDLGFGYEPADWPLEMVDRWLPEALASVADRADHRLLLAWVLRRADGAPELGPWR